MERAAALAATCARVVRKALDPSAYRLPRFRKSTPVAVLVAALLVAPAGGALVASPAPAVDPQDPSSLLPALAGELSAESAAALEKAVQAEEDAQALAGELASAPDLASLLERSIAADGSGRFSLGEAPSTPTYGSLEEALVALAEASGTPVTAAQLAEIGRAADALDPGLEEVLVDLAEGMVVGAEFRDRAFAALAPEDVTVLRAALSVPTPSVPQKASADEAVSLSSGVREIRPAVAASDPARDAALAKVDFHALATGSRAVLAAVDEALPRLEALQASAAAAPAAPLIPVAPGCNFAAPLVNVPGILAVGGPGAEGFSSDYILSVDLGGGDVYCNNAGGTLDSGTATLAWDSDGVPCSDVTFLVHPVAVAIDIAGNDLYHSVVTDVSSSFVGCYEGAGNLGIGVLVDVQGNDLYNSQKILVDPNDGVCPAQVPGTTMTPGGPVTFLDAGSQGAGLVGVGVLLDVAGDDRYDSGNTLCDDGAFVDLSVHSAQGAANTGIGIFVDVDGSDDYVSDNTLTSVNATAWSFLFVSGSQGYGALAGIGVQLDLGGLANDYVSFNSMTASPVLTLEECSGQEYFVGWSQGHGEVGGIGALVSTTGFDHYNSRNTMTTTGCDEALSYWLAYADQGTAILGGLGVLVDRYSSLYDSYNTISGPYAAYNAFLQQGVGALVGVGVLVDVDGADMYNSRNTVTGGNALPVAWSYGLTPFLPAPFTPWSAVVDIQDVQGIGTEHASLGVLVDVEGSDVYNWFNVLGSGTGVEYARIAGAQGAGVQDALLGLPLVLAAGVMLDLDSGKSDSYNSLNVGSAGILIVATEGASGFPVAGAFAPFALAGGVGVMVEVGTGDVYETGNAFPGPPAAGTCVLPFPLGTCIDWTHGVATLPLPAAFVDISAGGAVDTYWPIVPGGYALRSFGTWPAQLGFCLDLNDGGDLPAAHLCLPPSV